jgi:hypothetical protein
VGGLASNFFIVYGLLVILSALQDEPCRLRIAHAHCLQFERSGMVLMSHNREASKVTIYRSYFHPAHQHYTDEAHKGLIPRALFLGEMRNISPVSFELRLLE